MKTDNELIAEFMGFEKVSTKTADYWQDGSRTIRWDEIEKYTTSWDWLMPVVEKINTLGIDNFGQPCFVIHPNEAMICAGELKDVRFSDRTEIHGTLIICVYNVAVQFIKWYNTHSGIKEKE